MAVDYESVDFDVEIDNSLEVRSCFTVSLEVASEHKY